MLLGAVQAPSTTTGGVTAGGGHDPVPSSAPLQKVLLLVYCPQDLNPRHRVDITGNTVAQVASVPAARELLSSFGSGAAVQLRGGGGARLGIDGACMYMECMMTIAPLMTATLTPSVAHSR